MSDPTAPVEGTSTEAPAETTSTPEWAPVQSRVEELAGGMGELTSRFDQFLQSQQPAPDPEPDPWAFLNEDPEPDPYQQPQPQGVDPQQLQAAIQQQIQQGIQQGLSPIQQRLQQQDADRARDGLVAQHPQLKDPKVAQETENGMIAAYRAAGQSDEQIQGALSNAFLISQYIKAAEAEKLAAGQAPASSDVPAIEAAGGALPGGNGEPPNPVHAAFENQWQLPKGLR